MEKRIGKKRKLMGLSTLFVRYLLTTGAVLAVIAVMWWAVLMALMNSGFVLPASTAHKGITETIRNLEQAETFDGALIPHWYRWVRCDAQGNLIESGRLSEAQIHGIRRALAGDSADLSFPYSQYYAQALLKDGSAVLLQYDYSVPYGSAWMQLHLPDFQLCALLALLALLMLAGAITTRRFARVLRADAAVLTAATEAIAARRLDQPVAGEARVRELSAALDTIDELRRTLAVSLEEQWAMEQQRGRELAALAHDLKTPLTVIRGNAELLMEDELPPEDHKSVQAIARSVQRLEDYAARLREICAGEGTETPRMERASVAERAEVWSHAGYGLCAPRGITFEARKAPQGIFVLCTSMLDRAVLNLLDNAARYTPPGGRIDLRVDAADGQITIAVEDTGPGFSPEAIHRAGTVLYTQETSRPQDGHYGFGLYDARRTAQAHGGMLEIANRPEGGARAALILPAAEEQ